MTEEHAPVRMRDVAKHCGVAESTVSHVLNGTKAVSTKTKDKILKAVRELNYHRDSDARRLARGKSNFVGLIISDIENPFYPGLIKAFEQSAFQAGLEVLLCATNYDPVRTEAVFRQMIENKVTGVAVLTSRVDAQMAKYLESHRVPAVFLDAGGPSHLKSEIVINYETGARAAINYLYRLGHRDIALIAGPQDRASHRALREACDQALMPYQLQLRVIEEQNNASSGAIGAQKLLGEASMPTAILCSNDMTAMGAIRSLVKMGIRVPEEVSIVGADDIPFAELTAPPLTTIRIPRARIGQEAFALLSEMLGSKPGTPRRIVVDTELVIRESTAVGPNR